MTFWPSEKPALASAVSAAVSRLSQLVAELKRRPGDADILLHTYRQQLKTVCSDIDQNEYLGLLDLLVIMDEGLDRLIERGEALSDFELEFLNEFPGLLSDYLEMPGSKIAASILVKHFKKTQWIRPITLDEQKLLMGYILRSGSSEEPGRGKEIEAVDLSQYYEPVVDEQQGAEAEPVENVLNLDQMLAMNGGDDTPDDISQAVDNAENEHVDIEQFIGSAVDQPNEVDIDISTYDSDKDPGQEDLDASQQELIDLVKAELCEIAETTNQLNSKQQEGLREKLTDLAEQAENIGNAVNLMGLEGLSQASAFIARNLQHYVDTNQQINQQAIDLIKLWPTKILTCLENVFNASHALELSKFLHADAWILPIDPAQDEDLQKLLENPEFAEEEVESRQITAQADDVSLELPEEVNQELLDGLLQDLPAQTEEFSRSVQNLNEGGSLEDIEVAQRIAHTLKGAANVVGVKGIANLTHHLEDILEIQAKARKKPVRSLMDVLINASDCLESMSEALLGIDTPPDNAQQVLQNILDWANRLDSEGVPESDDKSPVVTSSLADSPDTKQVQANKNVMEKESAHVENMLRIPAALADELLRLAGENLISTGQVQEHLKNIEKSQDAIQLHNQSLQQISFDLEHLIDIQGVASQLNSSQETEDFDPLEMDKYNEMHSVSRRLIEIAADSIQLTSNLDSELTRLHDLVIDQNQLQKESQQLVLRTRMVSTKTVIPRLRRGVRQACRVTGKQVELEVEDNDTYMDSEVLNDLIEPLMHVLRNAVDHGIESAEKRKQAGKPEIGVIQLRFVRLGDQIVINVEDDGKGLDLQSIKRKAIDNGLVRADMELSDEAVSRLILEAGLSTRDEVTQVSGRGIGLDVVNVKIRELKGSINIFSDYGSGSRFELVLPISSFSTHSLLVRVREHIYAISNRGVEEILYPGLGELCEIGDETIFQLEDQAYGALLIDELLDFDDDRRKIDRSTRPILLVREESGAKTAILVQEVLDSRDVVVKSMGHYLPKLNGIIGATVLGDGSVAPVMDLPEMLQHKAARHRQLTKRDQVKEAPVSRLPYVLVVDDSLSARRSLAQFVQDLGMDVRTARDGMEAVSLIEARRPDLMLVDMEMPRMNGLELTSHIRAGTSTNGVPVIMITSRSTDKHRAAAIEKGVNHFMVKPFAEEELAQYINDALDIAS